MWTRSAYVRLMLIQAFEIRWATIFCGCPRIGVSCFLYRSLGFGLFWISKGIFILLANFLA